MKGEMLFRKYYEPGLIRQNIDNVVLRTYTHIQGFATDDPANSTKVIFTPRMEVDWRMNETFSIFGEDRGMAITSIVSVGALQRHLFLLDCALLISDDNERELLGVLRRSFEMLPALEDGMVLRTKNSYHIIGFRPLSLNEWHHHMAQAILLKTGSGNPIADVRYIGHSLEREYGSLRISDYLGKATPDFICRL